MDTKYIIQDACILNNKTLQDAHKCGYMVFMCLHGLEDHSTHALTSHHRAYKISVSQWRDAGEVELCEFCGAECTRLDAVDLLELEALTLRFDRNRLEARIRGAISVLDNNTRARFHSARLDYDGAYMLGDNGLVAQWFVRDAPNKPIAPDNQQTSSGVVHILIRSITLQVNADAYTLANEFVTHGRGALEAEFARIQDARQLKKWEAVVLVDRVKDILREEYPNAYIELMRRAGSALAVEGGI